MPPGTLPGPLLARPLRAAGTEDRERALALPISIRHFRPEAGWLVQIIIIWRHRGKLHRKALLILTSLNS